MFAETVVILGIPVDNLGMDEAVERIFAMVEDYRRDRRPRLVATVNVDFVVNTLTWRLTRIRHPELLDILRRAELVTADGMPLVVISKLLGTPLKGRVTGADLVPRLAGVAAQRGKSLYFLGGREGVTNKAASVLRDRYPNLEIAGIDSPFVYVEGEDLADAEEVDREIVDRINDAKPDILLIAFGNPKQEVWFNRNRNRLRVPVSIGIGGTFEFIAGSVRRAPPWMQRTGLEWIFRITQDPARLWKRYAVGFLKFGLMVWPAVLYYRFERLRHQVLRAKETQFVRQTDGSAPAAGGFLSVLPLPDRLDMVSLESLSETVDRALSPSGNLVLDFTQVRFIDSTGLGFLIRTLRRAESRECELHLVGISPGVRRFFDLNRTWDSFREKSRDRIEEVLTRLDTQDKLPAFHYSMITGPDLAVLSLFGRLDAQQAAAVDMAALTAGIGNRHCILDLSRLDFVDSSGLTLFFRIRKSLADTGRRCVLCALTDNVKQLFRLTRLDRLFPIAPDPGSARRMIEGIP